MKTLHLMIVHQPENHNHALESEIRRCFNMGELTLNENFLKPHTAPSKIALIFETFNVRNILRFSELKNVQENLF